MRAIGPIGPDVSSYHMKRLIPGRTSDVNEISLLRPFRSISRRFKQYTILGERTRYCIAFVALVKDWFIQLNVDETGTGNRGDHQLPLSDEFSDRPSPLLRRCRCFSKMTPSAIDHSRWHLMKKPTGMPGVVDGPLSVWNIRVTVGHVADRAD